MRDLGFGGQVQGTVVTVGTFDGFHLGHRDVVDRLVERAAALRLPSVLVTFEPHPLAVVRPESAPLLLTPPLERLAALAGARIDRVVVLPFTPALAALSPTSFVDELLRDRYGMTALLIGHDHGFGRGRSGDVDALVQLGAARGFQVDVVEPVLAPDGAPISSTRVRQAVEAGDLDGAAVLLGRRYAATGRVVAGAARGRTIGFRTLNIALGDARKLLPPLGVYAVRVATPTGSFGGMLNLGARPTFGDDAVGIEAHLFDANGDWYDATVQVEFVARLRDIRPFPGANALRAQLAADEQDARRALTSFVESGKLTSSTRS